MVYEDLLLIKRSTREKKNENETEKSERERRYFV